MAIWSAHIDGVTNLHVLEILRQQATVGKLRVNIGKVHLDHQIKVSLVIVTSHRGVRTNGQFIVDGGRHGDVLTGGQTKGVLTGWQAKTESASVVRDHLLLNQWHRVLFLVVLEQYGTRFGEILFGVQLVDEVRGKGDGNAGQNERKTVAAALKMGENGSG